MPTKPKVSTLKANTVGILNTLRANASAEYYKAVPEATDTTDSIRAVGTAIMGHQSLRNEFIDTLVNRIALVLITSRSYSNPLAWAKRGYLELGETVEEIFVEMAKAHPFDPDVAESEVFKREIPDVKTMFHMINVKAFYKQTVSNDQLRAAFLSWDGVTDLVSRIVQAMYSGMAWDEYIMTKYMIDVLLLNGNLATTAIPVYTDAANANQVVTAIKSVSNQMEFPRTDYNIAGVANFVEKKNQYLLQTSAFSANIDVNSLAKAFNLSYVEFEGKNAMVDSFAFTAAEKERLAALLNKDSSFAPFTDEENQKLASVGAVLVDRDFFMIFDNLQEATSIYNSQGLYYNNTLHVWKIFSASPFADAMAFTTLATTVNTVTVTPAKVTSAKGTYTQFSAAVDGAGFVNQGVTWGISGQGADSKTNINSAGLLFIDPAETGTTITVTATSTVDPTKTDTATVTVGT